MILKICAEIVGIGKGIIHKVIDMDENNILEQFHYFNIHADVDSVYGNWAVSTDGDEFFKKINSNILHC